MGARQFRFSGSVRRKIQWFLDADWSHIRPDPNGVFLFFFGCLIRLEGFWNDFLKFMFDLAYPITDPLTLTDTVKSL